jgi:membrane protease YdiL (CAAX protease family)
MPPSLNHVTFLGDTNQRKDLEAMLSILSKHIVMPIRNSKFWSLFVAAILIILIFWVTSQIHLVSGGDKRGEVAYKFFFGAATLVSGIILFGFKAMGLLLRYRSLQRFLIVLIPITATLVLNALGTHKAPNQLSTLDIMDFLATGFWEEVFFRAFLFSMWGRLIGLKNRWLRVLALALIAFVFGLFHMSTDISLLFRTELGVILGMVYLYTGSLFWPMALHAFNNGLAGYTGGATTDPMFQVIIVTLLSVMSIIIVFRQSEREYEL